MKMDDRRNKPGGKIIVAGEIVPAEFVTYFRWAMRNGVYSQWKKQGGNLEKFFNAWKRGEV